MATINPILDVILIIAALWMVVTVRGLGGIIGKGLTSITIGAVILGVAHLLQTLLHLVIVNNSLAASIDPATESFIHRIIVLAGFVVLIVGFRQIEAIKK